MTTNGGIAIRRKTHHCLNMHDRKPVRFQNRIAIACVVAIGLSGCELVTWTAISAMPAALSKMPTPADHVRGTQPKQIDFAGVADESICREIQKAIDDGAITAGDTWSYDLEILPYTNEAKARGLTPKSCSDVLT